MKFNITIDKKAEAEIDSRICINCGECRETCPTGAIEEYRKTVVPMKSAEEDAAGTFADTRNAAGRSADTRNAAGSFADTRNAAGSFADARRLAVERSCSTECPLGIVPQAVASFICRGEVQRAAEYIRERNPLAGTCAYVCDHFCREACSRSLLGDEPLNMRALEAFVLSNTPMKPLAHTRKYNEKIAIIGGGPAGLSAAYHLSEAGYPVTVFEKDAALGGAARWGISNFRLDKGTLDKEIKRITAAGVEVRTGCCIGEDLSLDEIWSSGYSACLIATGCSYGEKFDIKGAESAGVYDAVKVLRQITGGEEEGVEIGDSVVISCGEGAAKDLARVLARMDRRVLCMVSDSEEKLAREGDLLTIFDNEGIEVRASAAIGEIISENGRVKAVELMKVEHTEDEKGRARSYPDKSSVVNYFCDTVIFDSGQKCEIGSICNAETYPGGCVKIDENHKTNKQMLFACGDATGETGSVVEAVAAGRAAAEQMQRALHATACGSAERVLHNAPDGKAVYEENVLRTIPQLEKKNIVPMIDREDPFLEEDEEAFRSAGESALHEEAFRSAGASALHEEAPMHAEDAEAIIRAAGIGEDMRAFEFDEDARRVAIVGGGMAGVTAALSLAKKGYRPAIFEKEPELGGCLRWLSTDKRIDREMLRRELKKVEQTGIEVIYNVSAGVRPTIGQMFRLGYDAVLFAIGENGGRKHNIEGAGCSGVLDMSLLMGRLADNEKIAALGDRVLVVGGDEMSFDLAGKLKELCSEVTVLAPWSKGSMQAKTGAVDAVLNEGVNLVTGVTVSEIEQADGRVNNVICCITEKGYNINVPCDTVVLGGGGPDTQTIAINNLRLDMDEETGHIAVDKKLAASIRGVFSIGNLEMSAPDAGRLGAAALDNYLSGADTYIDTGDGDKVDMPVVYEMIEGRIEPAVKGFEELGGIYTAEEAVLEASRCMRCGYHDLKSEMCMGCGVCERACPVKAVDMKEVQL